MKCIDADLLRKEIERRREANKRQYHSSAGGTSWQRMCGEEDCLVELLAFLDSLQQEQQEVDLDKEIDKTVNECTDGYNFDWDKFALHFYELGKNSK